MRSDKLRRHPDGSIDHDFYRAKARALRTRAIRRLLRRTAACIVVLALAGAGAVARVWRGRPPFPRRSKRRLRSANVPSFT
jgi:hypothetical protein